MSRQAQLLQYLQTISDEGKQISVVGSMNADYTVTTERFPQPGESVNGSEMSILPGGKSGNQAASAAKLGANVRIFGAVGTDSNASFLIDELSRAGVQTDAVKRIPGQSGMTVITVDSHGENTIVYLPGANSAVDVAYVQSAAPVLTSSAVLGLCLETSTDTVIAAAKICHDAGVPVLLNDSPFVPELPKELIDNTDILLVNEHEMAQLLNIEEPADGNWDNLDWNAAAKKLHEFGYKKAIITLGAAGSMVIDNSELARIAPVPVDAVDTTGCGDAFMGTVLAGLSAGLTLEAAACLASCVSAYAAKGRGAQASYGTAEQIAAFIRENVKD